MEVLKIHKVLFLCIGLMISCSNPAKLLDKGNPEKALTVLLKKLENKKIKKQVISDFEEAFTTLNKRDYSRLQNLQYKTGDDKWPEIFDQAIVIRNRQELVQQTLDNLSLKGIKPNIEFIEVNPIIEQSRASSATYFYNLAQAYNQDALDGDKTAARKSHDFFQQTLDYFPVYKDAIEKAEEMKKIGTSHLLVNPLQGRLLETYANYMFKELFSGEQFPIFLDWNIIHLHEDDSIQFDYLVDLEFDSPFISGDQQFSSVCNTSVEIENGFRVVSEWSVADSAFVERQEPIYVNVNATITTFEQRKSAESRLNVRLRPISELNVLEETYFTGATEWENVYSNAIGDDRAIRDGDCINTGGTYAIYPSDDEMLSDAIADSQYSFYNWLRDFD